MSGIIELAFLILFGATVIVAFGSRLKLPVELLLLGGSLVLGFIPGLPVIALQPELVFLLFLPPILFQAAYFTSWRDFKANKRPIALLAVGLVLFTTVVVAVVVKYLVPSMPWALAFMLGAMVSPPDASAATAITRKLGVPRRLVTIIEGESLVNDATALVAYRFALAAALTGVFSLGASVLRLLWVGAGGVVVGWMTGFLAFWLLKKLEETRAQILLSLITAFGAYVFGELLQVSGVIATVTAGLYFGRHLPGQSTPQTRVEGKANWDFVVFVINAFVFTMIGLQLRSVMSHLSDYSRVDLLLYAAVVNAAVIIVRFAWVFPATYVPRWIFPSLRRTDPAPPWQVLVVLGWTAMRGIVSLAAAMALPETLPSGEPFPHRHLLIFITYTVILVTLILPSLTLPSLLRRLGIKNDDENRREEIRSRISIMESAIEMLSQGGDGPRYSRDHVEQLRQRYARRLKILQSNMADQAFSPINDEDQQRRRLLRDLIRSERSALERQRAEGLMHDEVFHAIANELDLEELRLNTQRI